MNPHRLPLRHELSNTRPTADRSRTRYELCALKGTAMSANETNTLSPDMLPVLACFDLGSAPVSCQPFGAGHVNRTYLITTASTGRYILQRVSSQMTDNIPALIENIRRVTDFLREKAADPDRVLTLLDAAGGKPYTVIDGAYWRVYRYVENTICLQQAETPDDFCQVGRIFGQFEEDLRDYPAESLFEVIPHFHDTAKRYADLMKSCEADVCGRADSAREEIAFAMAHEGDVGKLEELRRSGALPTRATHNDTKLNNVLFDADTREAVCLVDLDTVMPGLSLYDFGDAIRYGASTAAEDETDLSKVELDTELFRAFTRGFTQACRHLTDLEKDLLPEGARIITLEIGMRFLADYLDGDVYFGTAYPTHNLVRARTQFKLVREIETKYGELQQIVKEECGQV